MKKDVLEKLIDLHHQATTEHSHFYTASVIIEAMEEIAKLRKYKYMYESLCKLANFLAE